MYREETGSSQRDTPQPLPIEFKAAWVKRLQEVVLEMVDIMESTYFSIMVWMKESKVRSGREDAVWLTLRNDEKTSGELLGPALADYGALSFPLLYPIRHLPELFIGQYALCSLKLLLRISAIPSSELLLCKRQGFRA